MMKQKIDWHPIFLVVCAALIRLVSVLPPNFSPIGAMGLFGGARLRLPIALLVTGMALLLSDMVIGFYSPIGMVFNYLGMGVGVLLGHGLLRNQQTMLRYVAAATLGAIAFFVLSNLGVWLAGDMYPMTYDGLSACFIAAIPFFQSTLTSNLVFTCVLFGLDHLFVKPSLAYVKIK